ncbi:MAG: hypothetical protein AB1632_11490 [Nitrospirota bacterium]
MATLKTIEYACDICGTRIAVTGDGTGHVSPIYCCGVLVTLKNLKEVKKKETGKQTGKTAKRMVSAGKKRTKSAKKIIAVKKPKK